MNGLSYLLQSNLYLIIFFGFYWVLLRKETFNNYNRAYLLISALISFLIPISDFETVQSWFLTTKTTQIIQTVTLADFSYIKPVEQSRFSLNNLLSIIYTIGCSLLAMKLAANVFNLYKYINGNETFNKAFSFFNNIFITNGADPDDVIYDHERVHAQQYHSFDVLFFEIIGIFCWFNPIVYAYKVAIKNIHEFIADDIASQSMPSKIDYAMLLFSERFQTHPSVLVNNFFTKTSLKIRIEMLNKEKSKKTAVLKYGLITPMFLGMLVFASANINAEKLSVLLNNANLEKNQIIVSGQVLNEDNKPLVGTNIIVKGKNKGTTADLEGKFTIKLDNPNETLIVSHIGYFVKEIKPNANNTSLVVLQKQVDELMGSVVLAYSQTMKEDVLKEMKSDSIIKGNEVFTVVEQQPEYPGGQEEMSKFLSKNLRYPVDAVEKEQQGKVFLKFVVDTEGEISNIKVLKSAGPGLDEEAVRVVGKMPTWKPAKQNGRKVNAEYVMPIEFILDGKENKEKLILIGGVEKDMSNKLYILDGEIISEKEFNSISPEKIKSLNVIKGQDAIKMYGEKGKNGVLLITTKKEEVIVKLKQEEMFKKVDENPSFPGGNKEMNKFISRTMRYPVKAQRENIKGKVFLKFLVQANGDITDIQILKGLGYGLDEEAVRIIKAMPKWIPAKSVSENVNAYYNMPISFVLE
jgi:TonB family protein